MPARLVKCASRCCEGRSFYPNQITDVEVSGASLPLCPDCYKYLMDSVADKKLVGRLIVDSVSLGERQRVKVERAENYARSEVGFESANA